MLEHSFDVRSVSNMGNQLAEGKAINTTRNKIIYLTQLSLTEEID